MILDLCFIGNVFNVIIVSVAIYVYVLLYVCNLMGVQVLSLNPES